MRVQSAPRWNRVSAVVVALGLAALALWMPASWLDRAVVDVPGSRLAPQAAAWFVRGALALNALLLLLWGLLHRATRQPDSGAGAADAATRTRPPLLRRELVVLAAVMVLAAALRFWKLGTDLWFDEVIDLVYYVRGPVEDLVLRFPGFVPQVTSALAAKLSMGALGETPFAFRLPAALAGVAGVGAVFFLARHVLGRWGAAWTALLLAVAYHHVFFSQTARGYSIQVLLTIAATYALFRAAETDSRRAWLVYGAVSVLNLYTQVFAIFVVAGMAAAWAGRLLWARGSEGAARGRWAAFLWTHAFIAAATFLLYSPMMVALLARTGVTADSLRIGRTFVGFFDELLQGLQAGYGSAALIAGAAVFLSGAVSLWRRNAFWTTALLLPVVLGLGAVVAGAIGAHPRYLIYVMPAGLIVVVRGIEVWAEWGARLLRPAQRDAVTAGICALVVLAGAALSLWKLGPYYALPKQDFTGALHFAAQARQPQEPLVAVGTAAQAYSLYYAPDIHVVRTVEELERLREQGSRVWLLYTLAYVLREQHPELMEYIEQHFETVRRFPGSVYQAGLYVSRAEPLPGRTAGQGAPAP